MTSNPIETVSCYGIASRILSLVLKALNEINSFIFQPLCSSFQAKGAK